jgi:uncharacterized membrane protein
MTRELTYRGGVTVNRPKAKIRAPPALCKERPPEENNMAGAMEKWHRMRIRHQHHHPPIRNVNKAIAESMTIGARAADAFASAVGSWTFILTQSVILVFWITLNVIAWIRHWDPYPFILLNLALSFQAAYAAPIIMMSQNRQAAKDRLMAEQDYLVNTKAEEELKSVMQHLETQDDMMLDLLRQLHDQHAEMLVMMDGKSGAPPPAAS